VAARRVTPADPFRSLEDKKSFLRLAVGSGILFGLLFALAMGLFFRGLFLQMDSGQGKDPQAYRVAWFNQEYWYLTKNALKSGTSDTYTLWHRQPGAVERVKAGAFNADHDVFLLAGPQDPGRLWICSQDKTGYWDRGGFQWVDDGTDLGDIIRPFFVGSEPATMSHVDGAVSVWTLAHGKQWRKSLALQLQLPHPAHPSDCSCNRLRAVWRRGSFTWFYKDGWDIRRFEGTPQGRDLNVSGWAVAVKDSAEANWAPVALPGGLMLVDQERGAREPTVRVWSGSGPAWKRLDAFAEKAGSAALLGGGPADWKLVLAGPGLRVDAAKSAGLPPLVLEPPPALAPMLVPLAIFYACLLLGPLVLLLVLQSGLDRHRSRKGRLGRRAVVYASLRRRALARLLDSLLVLAGLFLLMVGAMLVLALAGCFKSNAGGAMPLLGALGLMACMALGLLAGNLALVHEEGRSGQTPGRKLLGIRVLGTDLKPCGFQRAFLRALLSLVDGFWQWVVGVYVIAFSPRYQRLGDLLGDTVVLMEPASAAPPASGRPRSARPPASR
jgi:uncharacterized RDD family membrane protein YckC